MAGMLSPELLDLIRCPVCKGELDYSEPQQTLRCAACPRTYPIRDGIPVLFVDQATKKCSTVSWQQAEALSAVLALPVVAT